MTVGTEVLATIPVADYTAVIRRFNEQEKSDHAFILYAHQLEICQKKQLSQCDLYGPNDVGSAFVVHNGQTISTAWHVAAGKDKFRAKEKPKKLSFILADREGKVVFSTLDGERASPIYPASNPDEKELNQRKFHGFTPMMEDRVLIKLSKSTGKPPLKPVAKTPPPGTRVYVLGYPSKTTNRESYGGTNSNGDGLYVSKGHIADPNTLDFGFKYNQAKILGYLQENYLTFVTADSSEGSSGGPIVTDEGELISSLSNVFVRSPEKSIADEFPRASIGPKNEFINTLLKVAE